MTEDRQNHNNLARKNGRIAAGVFLFVFFMIGMSFAAVPLYDLFCRVTGFGGTTQVAEELPENVLERQVTVNFNANTSRMLPWDFRPEERSIRINIGQKGLTAYTARNQTARPLTGTAIYNVTPQKVGKYFHKIECFCFAEQTLGPGEQVNMPVMFFVDPAIADDPDMDDVKVITLSYTFFQAHTQALEDALEDFYNQASASGGPAGHPKVE